MEQILWVEKYRPRTVRDTILPKEIKQKFQTFVDQKQIPNLLLCGGSGVGKTTVARAMLDELGCDYIIINGSSEGGIETLRNDIMRFASSVSLEGGRKYVILDEADYLTSHMQPALRNFMEEFSINCGFILTCNFKNRIIKALHSRCSVVEFSIPSDEKVALSKEFMLRAAKILDENNIGWDAKVLATVIKKHFPDWRRVLNELQYYSAAGKIDAGILTNLNQIALSDLVAHMKEKNFTSVRKWVAENSNMDSSEFYREFYNSVDKIVNKKDIPYLVLLISKYSYQDAMALDKEINTAAFLVEVMANCEMK
jgi:DNA polymerase III delta prime subunit